MSELIVEQAVDVLVLPLVTESVEVAQILSPEIAQQTPTKHVVDAFGSAGRRGNSRPRQRHFFVDQIVDVLVPQVMEATTDHHICSRRSAYPTVHC